MVEILLKALGRVLARNVGIAHIPRYHRYIIYAPLLTASGSLRLNIHMMSTGNQTMQAIQVCQARISVCLFA
jgi:hypothetical protein